MEMLATQGITATRPMRKLPTSTTGSASSKVITTVRAISLAHKEVIRTIIQITIQTMLGNYILE
jgi:hypothetical protein